MPTYDYECDACGHKMELFQGINDPVESKCPECKKKKLRRLFGTGAAIVFKGSGFYQTDYRSEGYKKAAAADKSSGDSSSSSESKSSDSKSSESKSSDAKPASESKSTSSTDSKPKGDAKPKKKDR